MRLICGLVRLDGAPADGATLDPMISAMTPRDLAPRIARRTEGPAALAVLDFGLHGPPPQIAVDAASGTWLAADLRLDRPRDLATALDLPAGTAHDALALAAVARWGRDTPDRLDGDFAIAAWDPSRQRLLCARDIMGVRPLCYSHIEGCAFVFASLPEGVHGGGIERRLDMLAIGQLAADHYLSGPLTGFEGIAWLEAGHSLNVSRDGFQLHRAWRPDPARVGTWRGTAREAAAELRKRVKDAVRARLPATGPVASHLSGGVDSSSVAVIAARQLRQDGRQLHAFSMLARPVAGVSMLDERPYVEAVLAQEPDIVWSAAHMPLPDELAAIDPDLPISGGSLAPDDRICAAARAAGADMLLSGAGGDETATYSGPAIYAALFRQCHWRTLHAELASRAAREGRSLPGTVGRRLVAPLLPAWLRQARRHLLGLPAPVAPDRLRFLSSAFRAKVEAAMPIEPPVRNRPADRIAALTDSYIIDRGTRWAQIGARHGIAFSFPLLDRRIIDFVLSLPITRFVSDGLARQPYRTAMSGILPELIRTRESKFVPFPDAPLTLAAAKPALLKQAEAVRRVPTVAAHFDLDRIAAAIADLPEGDAAKAAARAVNSGVPQLRLRRAIDATQALRLALHVARLAGSA